MSRFSRTTIAFFLACATSLFQQARAQGEILAYSGRCDASAAAPLDADHFIVANDERNELQIYKRGRRDPVASVDIAAFLGTRAGGESDLEAAATVGSRIYWISSHAANMKGRFQERRLRFFATDIEPGETPRVRPVGSRPYVKLLDDMLADERLKGLLSRAAKLPPEAPGGLNIEGLAAAPVGRLLIGFRNPIPEDGALIVVLENPGDVLEGRAARFAAPVRLKGLDGNGIRSIDRIGASYLVVGGPPGDKGSFALHRWSGNGDEAATLIRGVDFKGLQPEAMFAVSADTVQIVSDDGGVIIDGKECKALDEANQSFRTLLLRL